ncbi:unnamed protein product [Vitrella brassicaformis CCMP3155]|uniref:Uncharacterized protein n=1 Tax=Vitrella brassicaformis (strain CCMP3155) TaxID=1169540 RepID=A0A0G4GY44_VITBC|nr:unnamed protein product [Vitrella brassicaformis CCMP3155]|eukprot:CEM35963.1 unnamed protein product [Vitrella brassicaformis CCMP3155]
MLSQSSQSGDVAGVTRLESDSILADWNYAAHREAELTRRESDAKRWESEGDLFQVSFTNGAPADGGKTAAQATADKKKIKKQYAKRRGLLKLSFPKLGKGSRTPPQSMEAPRVDTEADLNAALIKLEAKMREGEELSRVVVHSGSHPPPRPPGRPKKGGLKAMASWATGLGSFKPKPKKKSGAMLRSEMMRIAMEGIPDNAPKGNGILPRRNRKTFSEVSGWSQVDPQDLEGRIKQAHKQAEDIVARARERAKQLMAAAKEEAAAEAHEMKLSLEKDLDREKSELSARESADTEDTIPTAEGETPAGLQERVDEIFEALRQRDAVKDGCKLCTRHVLAVDMCLSQEATSTLIRERLARESAAPKVSVATQTGERSGLFL